MNLYNCVNESANKRLEMEDQNLIMKNTRNL